MIFQPVKCHLCEKLLQSYELLKAHQTLPNHCGTCKEPFKTTCQLLQHKCEGEAKNLIISNTVSKKFWYYFYKKAWKYTIFENTYFNFLNNTNKKIVKYYLWVKFRLLRTNLKFPNPMLIYPDLWTFSQTWSLNFRIILWKNELLTFLNQVCFLPCQISKRSYKIYYYAIYLLLSLTYSCIFILRLPCQIRKLKSKLRSWMIQMNQLVLEEVLEWF